MPWVEQSLFSVRSCVMAFVMAEMNEEKITCAKGEIEA